MTSLGGILSRLGLEEYHDALVDEGFDTWETVCDIQESDLVALNFKRGHRRKLQREIANYRGIPYERSLGSPTVESTGETGRGDDTPLTPTETQESGTHAGSETKRKYRRHPKPDENAPMRPNSAYVIFSNDVREEVRGQNLSFAEIAKLVGDRWQKLSPAEKEPYESQAAAAKERYNAELAEYRKTDAYREYLRYLAQFKAKHGGAATHETKRPKFEQQSSGGSTSIKSLDSNDTPMSMASHMHVGSMGPSSPGVSHSEVMVATSSFAGKSSQGAGTFARLPPISPSMDTSAPFMLPRDPRQHATLSAQSSVSDESVSLRDYAESLSSAARLSLLPGSSRLPDKTMPSPPGLEHGRTLANRRPVRVRTPLQGHSATSGSTSGSASGSGSLGSQPSNLSTSEGSYMRSGSSSVDDSWRLQLPESGFPTKPTTTLSMQFGSLTMPSLGVGERTVEGLPDQSQRILPPPTSSAPQESAIGYRGFPRIADITSPRQTEQPGLGLSLRRSHEQSSGLHRSESEAADALADLAHGTRVQSPDDSMRGKQPPYR